MNESYSELSAFDAGRGGRAPDRSLEKITDMNTYGPVATHIALWLTMLSPLIVFIAFLGALFFSQTSG